MCIIGVVEKPKQTMCPEELLHLTDTQFYMELRFLSDLLAAGLLQPSFRRSFSTFHAWIVRILPRQGAADSDVKVMLTAAC